MPKPLELRKVKRILKKYGIVYVTGKGRHPKFYDPETHATYPIKSHGKKLSFCLMRSTTLLINLICREIFLDKNISALNI